jgi:hypothetical protein
MLKNINSGDFTLLIVSATGPEDASPSVFVSLIRKLRVGRRWCYLKDVVLGIKF